MMTDALSNFDWSTLYSRYDATCKRFDQTSVYLSAYDSSRPLTDRELYYRLIDSLSAGKRKSLGEPITIYEALLYWKLYSQRVTNSNLQLWLRQDIAKRQRIQEELRRLFESLPIHLEKRSDAVVDAVKSLGAYQIPGMGKSKSAALPVRTTLLHFVYPSVVPVFDQMVLKSVDLWFKDANKKLPVLERYLPVAWELAERYTRVMPQFPNESPIRVIDMALWVARGGST
jgi:hypothetical protein